MTGSLSDLEARYVRPRRPPDLKVSITLLTTAEGGRKFRLWQGCRLPNDFGIPGEANDAMYEFSGSAPEPGTSAEAVIWLLAPERNLKRLHPGFKFRLLEGKCIGTGTILQVLNSDLLCECSS